MRQELIPSQGGEALANLKPIHGPHVSQNGFPTTIFREQSGFKFTSLWSAYCVPGPGGRESHGPTLSRVQALGGRHQTGPRKHESRQGQTAGGPGL